MEKAHLQHLDEILTSAPFGYALFDRELRFLRINTLLAEINGYSAAAHIGKTLDEILPGLKGEIHRLVAQIIATDQPVLNYECVGQTARLPEDLRHWNASWYPVRNASGEIVGFSAMVVDITEQKRSEETLRRSNERFALAVKTSQAVLWQQDLDLRFTWLHNPASGVDSSNAIGNLESALLERAEDVTFIESIKREVIRSGIGTRTEFRPQIQGVVRCFDVWMDPLHDHSGRITGLTGAAIDVTERESVIQAQHETDRYYQALAEASLEIPYRMSADWSTMQALDGGDLVASSAGPLHNWTWIDQNIPLVEHSRVRQAIREAIANGRKFELEHMVIRPDGSEGWTHSRAVSIFDKGNKLIAWFGVAIDVTERKRVKQKLIEATEAAESANRAKSEFLLNMSHEFRTPLNSILGFAQLLESGSPELSAGQKEKLDFIIKGGWYLLHLVNEILDLAQIESGKLTFLNEPFSLIEVMLECQDLLAPLASERRVTLNMSSHLYHGFAVADRTRVKQVLINLLSNAIKYNRVHGAVTFEVTVRSPDVVRVSVRDTGAGLTPEKLEQLFQSFNRLGHESSHQQGTGVGLVMTKRLVELMGGTVGVVSEVGVGSVFWFELKWLEKKV